MTRNDAKETESVCVLEGHGRLGQTPIDGVFQEQERNGLLKSYV